MSLVALALRLTTVQLLRGATLALERVHDSMIDPADLLTSEAAPFIVVAVDSAEKVPRGRDILGSSRTICLTLDVALAANVTAEVPAGEDVPPQQVIIPHTDAGMEIVLDLIGRQIDRAVLSESPWGRLWKTFVVSIDKVRVDRGASDENGVRYATRQIIFDVETMAEPSFGSATGIWVDFLAQARATPELAGIADLIEHEIQNPSLEGWARAQADLAVRTQFGLGGEQLLEPPPQPVAGVTWKYEGGSWVDDAQRADEVLGPELIG